MPPSWRPIVGQDAVSHLRREVVPSGGFALAHLTCLLARLRLGPDHAEFKTPFFPAVPIVGGLLCLCLAGFQAFQAPSAGVIVLGLLALGTALYVASLSRRAHAVDAFSEANDPTFEMRPRTLLVDTSSTSGTN